MVMMIVMHLHAYSDNSIRSIPQTIGIWVVRGEERRGQERNAEKRSEHDGRHPCFERPFEIRPLETQPDEADGDGETVDLPGVPLHLQYEGVHLVCGREDDDEDGRDVVHEEATHGRVERLRG